MKKLLLFCYTILILLGSSSSYGQINFSFDNDGFPIKPENNQLYPRNSKTNSAIVQIIGEIDDGYSLIRFNVYQDNNLLTTPSINPEMSGNRFSFAYEILATNSSYRFEAIFDESERLLIADNVVCGDVFLIAGQSNANAMLGSEFGDNHNSNYSNPFCRSFGKQMWRENTTTPVSEARWAVPSSIDWHNGFVGAWGIVIQQSLMTNYNVPICIINGSYTGTAIDKHLPSSANFTDVKYHKLYNYNIYEHAIAKAKAAKVKDHVKAIFWYQGEADSSFPDNYIANFNSLYNSWDNDYPSLERIYVIQIHTGVTNSNTLREMQRSFYSLFPKVKLISTMGIGEGYHGSEADEKPLHYTVAGYEKLANIITPMVTQDFYCQSSNSAVSPPNVQKAFYHPTIDNLLVIEFDQIISIQKELEVYGSKWYLKDYIYENYINNNSYDLIELNLVSNNIDSIGNKIYLKVVKSNIEKITYLPSAYYNYDTLVYEGPWIMNQNNTIGALSFSNLIVGEERGIGALSYAEMRTYNTPVGCSNTSFEDGYLCGTISDNTSIYATNIYTCTETPEANVLIKTNTNIELHASKGIQLKPGFIVQKGAVFKAQISNGGYCYAIQQKNNTINYTSIENNSQLIAGNNIVDSPFKIYPNPNSGSFMIDFNNLNNYDATICIYNSLGKKVKEFALKNPQTQINLLDQPNGVYIIQISDGEKMYHRKVIIQ